MTLQTKTLALTLAVFALTLAAPEAGHTASGRYQMTPTENGFMRLDTETGAVSLCKNDSGKVACEQADEQTDRYAKELDTLRQDNEKLRAELNRLEQHFGLGPDRNGKPNDLTPPVPPSTAFKLPKKEDVDEMFNYIEDMLKKFRERIKRLERESEGAREL